MLTELLSVTIWTLLSSAVCAIFHEYCIIGAGPGGLQLGYFLQRSGRDYIIFERNAIPGSFFEKYPRHRKLISINKQNTGRKNAEFNLRHDWNSLISDDPSLLFTQYSEDYFPHADEYLKYLKDYHERLHIAVQFNTNISNIEAKNGSSSAKFAMVDQHGNQYECTYLIVATGVSIPKRLNRKGSHLVEDYSTVSVDPNDFKDQAVMIIGWGNSGMETAQNLYGKAAYIHMAGSSRVRFSWETHYVGDARGVNNEIIDSYMLKSLDGFVGPLPGRLIFWKDENGKILLLDDKGGNQIFEHYPSRDGYDRVISCIGFKWDDSIFNKASINFTNYTEHQSRGFSRRIDSKYPPANYTYESLPVPGLYFAGGLAHSLDWRKSAGGFIHGYRYSVRALHRHLEWKNHQVVWPSISGSLLSLAPTLQKRMNEASGIYQMFTTFSDIAIVDMQTFSFEYLDEVPTLFLPHLPSLTGHNITEEHIIITLSLHYGQNFSQPGKDIFEAGRVTVDPQSAHQSNFLHPVVRLYHRLPNDPEVVVPIDWETLFKPYGIHHVLEDFTTGFNCPSTHGEPLRMFLEHHLGTDLRPFVAKACSQLVLFSEHHNLTDLPIGCERYVSSEFHDI